MHKKTFEDLKEIISAVTEGDYSSGKKLEQLLDKEKTPEEIADFVESLNLMTIKLEAREIALGNTISELKAKNSELNEAILKRNFFSTIFTSLFISVTFFIFLLFLVKDMAIKSDYSARVVEIIFFITTVIIIRKSKLPLSNFGVTLTGLKQSVTTVLPSTLLICGILVVLKYFLSLNNVQGFNGPIFVAANFNFLLILYIGIVLVQEFIARGVILTVIEHVIVGNNKKFWSILTASSLFALVHIQISFVFALISLGFGCYWGYLYLKERNLAGVSVSHFFIGSFAITLGFWDFLSRT
jgi:membrane protease YdiL (CAAX protease family)